jgi:hypothetical protein
LRNYNSRTEEMPICIIDTAFPVVHGLLDLLQNAPLPVLVLAAKSRCTLSTRTRLLSSPPASKNRAGGTLGLNGWCWRDRLGEKERDRVIQSFPYSKLEKEKNCS